MKKPFFIIIFVLATFPHDSLAQETKAEHLTINHAWTRATMTSNQAAAIYMEITNHGEDTERLLGAKSNIARMVMLHRVVIERNVARMEPLEALSILPNSKVELQTGGAHIMLNGLSSMLVDGDNIPLVLIFENAGEVTINVSVEGMSMEHRHNHNTRP